MGDGDKKRSPQLRCGPILVAGDPSKALLDAGELQGPSCQVHTDFLEAIEAAAKGRFAVIAVVIRGASGRLRSVLKALREASEGRIILLARMSEEPRARRLINAELDGSTLADDYMICPIRFSALAARISEVASKMPPPLKNSPEKQRTTPTELSCESRIRYLEKLATQDDLTGLKNRRYIWEFARQIIERARSEGTRVTLLVFDVDDLKRYNDLYGHLAGDRILRQVAGLIRRCCRRHDVVGRIGGDEFAVIFWDARGGQISCGSERRSARADHPAEAICIARRFVAELEKTEIDLPAGRGKPALAISGGLASFPRDGSTIEELFAQADKALLEAKRSGKNRIYLVGKRQNDIARAD